MTTQEKLPNEDLIRATLKTYGEASEPIHGPLLQRFYCPEKGVATRAQFNQGRHSFIVDFYLHCIIVSKTSGVAMKVMPSDSFIGTSLKMIYQQLEKEKIQEAQERGMRLCAAVRHALSISLETCHQKHGGFSHNAAQDKTVTIVESERGTLHEVFADLEGGFTSKPPLVDEEHLRTLFVEYLQQEKEKRTHAPVLDRGARALYQLDVFLRTTSSGRKYGFKQEEGEAIYSTHYFYKGEDYIVFLDPFGSLSAHRSRGADVNVELTSKIRFFYDLEKE